MSRRTTFREADISRAVKGVIKAGAKVQRVEIDAAGKIVVTIGNPPTANVGDSSWDEVLK